MTKTDEEVKEKDQEANEETKKSNEKDSKKKKNGPYSYATSFFELMALCNTVVCDQTSKSKKVEYKASSPDELALAMGSKQCGIKLISREHDRITI